MKQPQLNLDEFTENGFLIVRGLLDWKKDLQPVVKEYEVLLDSLISRWHDQGFLEPVDAELPFGERLIRSVMQSKQPYDQNFDISLPQAGITEETPMHHGPAVFDLLRSPRLLDAVEQFIGSEIYSNPVQHTRVKFPESKLPNEVRSGLTSRIDWHQDSGVITADADASDILTVWFPITDATTENGCMAVVPGSHRQGVSLHCHSRNAMTLHQVSIPARLMDDDQLVLPMQPGDVLFMHRRTKHSGLPNISDRIRWSFDLRYQATGQPTGRRWFPGFVARSRSRPETELHDAETWAVLWRDARSRLAVGSDVSFNRWREGDPLCA